MEMAMLDVPYRCPRCGGARTFNTLAELKAHMVDEHAYCAQRRSRSRIFDYSHQRPASSGRHSPLLQSFLDEGLRLEEEVKAAKTEEINNKLQRQNKSLSKSPSTAATIWVKKPPAKTGNSPRKVKVNFSTPALSRDQDPYLQESINHLNHEMLVQRQQHWHTADALYSTQDVLSGVEEAAEGRVSEQKNFIAELTHQLVEKEQQLLELRKELQTVRDNEKDKVQGETDSGNKNSIDPSLERMSRERQLIEEELLKKKEELENLNKQLTLAKQSDNRRREAESNRRKQESSPEQNQERKFRTKRPSKDNHSADISSHNSEGSDCSTMAASLSISRTSSSSTKNRSNQLKRQKQNLPNKISDSYPRHMSLPQRHHHINNKLRQDDLQRSSHDESLRSQKLKEERQALVQQMKELLSKANIDNEKLKDELVAKENHLQYLNQELERTKTDQTELMEETYDLYKEAEKSLGKLKERLKNKEAQLSQANSRLDELHQAHEKLVAEKETVAKTADDKDVLYLNMMRDRDEEIQSLKGLLESQQEEREKLTKTADELKQEIHEQEISQQQLSEAIKSKEEELAKAKDDVDTLSKFLQTAAAKESVARTKLEAFVTELIDRANCAEKELQRLQGLERSSVGNLNANPSQPVGLSDISTIPAHAELIQAGMPPLHSTPAAPQNGQQGLRGPWCNDLNGASLPTTAGLIPSGPLLADSLSALGSLPSETHPQLVSQQQAQVVPPIAGCRKSQEPHQGFVSQQVSPMQARYNHHPVLSQNNQQIVPQQSLHLLPQQIPPQNHQLSSQNSQVSIQHQFPSHQQASLPEQVPLLASQKHVPVPGQPLVSSQQSSLQQQLSSHIKQLPSQQYIELPSQQLVSQPQKQAPPQIIQQTESQQCSQPAYPSHPQGSQQLPSGRKLPSGQSIQQQPLAQQELTTKPPGPNTNRVRRNTNPFIDVYTVHHARPVCMSDMSEDLVFPPEPSKERSTENPQNDSIHYTYTSPVNSEKEDSSVYAALPRRGRIDSNPFRAGAALSRQSPAYDGGDEQVYSDSIEGHTPDGVSRSHSSIQMDSSGKVIHSGGSKYGQANPFTGSKNSSWTPTAAHNYISNGVPEKYIKESVNGHKNSSKKADPSTKSFSPNRTYPIYCVTGKEAKEHPWEDLSDSNYSHQDTPHFNVGIINRKPRGKGKLKPTVTPLNNMYPSKLTREGDDDSTDGLELSVDENGILWEAVDSFSEASQSYRMSPYGSETAGDVDSAVLTSSRSPGNILSAHVGQDTDEDVDSLDEEGILRPSQKLHGNATKTSERWDVQLPLGERISRILKTIGRDEDSESLDMLVKQNSDSRGKGVGDKNATSVYGTERRVNHSKGGSPLERALAVQDRVKSLTYPRTGKKSVTISDTSSSDLAANLPPKRGTGNGAKFSFRLKHTADQKLVSSKSEVPLKLDPLEEFSSSSYVSLPATAVSKSTTKVSDIKAKKDIGKLSSPAMQISPYKSGRELNRTANEIAHSGNMVSQNDNMLMFNGRMVSNFPDMVAYNASVVHQNPYMVTQNASMVSQHPSMVAQNASMFFQHPNHLIAENTCLVSQPNNLVAQNASGVIQHPNVVAHNASMVSQPNNLVEQNVGMVSQQPNNLVAQNASGVIQHPNVIAHNASMVSQRNNLVAQNVGMVSQQPNNLVAHNAGMVSQQPYNFVAHNAGMVSQQPNNLVAQNASGVIQHPNVVAHNASMVSQQPNNLVAHNVGMVSQHQKNVVAQNYNNAPQHPSAVVQNASMIATTVFQEPNVVSCHANQSAQHPNEVAVPQHLDVVSQPSNVVSHNTNTGFSHPNEAAHCTNVISQHPEAAHRSNVISQHPNEVTHSTNIVSQHPNEAAHSTNMISQHSEAAHSTNMVSQHPNEVTHSTNMFSQHPNEAAHSTNVISQHPEAAHSTNMVSQHPEAAHSTNVISQHPEAAHSTNVISQHPEAAHSTNVISQHPEAAHSTNVISQHPEAAHSTNVISQHPEAAHSTSMISQHPNEVTHSTNIVSQHPNEAAHNTNIVSQHPEAAHSTNVISQHPEAAHSTSMISQHPNEVTHSTIIVSQHPNEAAHNTNIVSQHPEAAHSTNVISQHPNKHSTNMISQHPEAAHSTSMVSQHPEAAHSTNMVSQHPNEVTHSTNMVSQHPNEAAPSTNMVSQHPEAAHSTSMISQHPNEAAYSTNMVSQHPEAAHNSNMVSQNHNKLAQKDNTVPVNAVDMATQNASHERIKSGHMETGASVKNPSSIRPENLSVDLPVQNILPEKNKHHSPNENGNILSTPTKFSGLDSLRAGIISEEGTCGQTDDGLTKRDESVVQAGTKEDLDLFHHETSTIKRQPSTGNAPLTRQASVTSEETEVQKCSDASLKQAKPLRARLAQSNSQSSVQSSECESRPTSPPLALPPPVPKDMREDDSTDFDLESDLEKFTTGGERGLKKGVVSGKPNSRKVLTKQKMKKSGDRKRAQALSVPDTWEDSGSNLSDAEAAEKKQRREKSRRRRVALFHVFSYLDARSLCKMSMVCREWKRVSRHPALWKNVHLKYERVSSKFLVTLAQWCTQLTSLTLEGLRCGTRKPSETLDEYNRRNRGCLEPGLEELLKTNHDTLTSLSIVACGNILTNKCMWLVSGYCRLMQRLMYLSDSHPVTGEVMWALGGGCPSITSLIIPPLHPCHKSAGLNNRCLMLIAQFYPDLLEVGVGGQSLDITGLVPLVQSCQRLTSVSLDHVRDMGDDTATALCRTGLRQLQRLKLSGTTVTANALKIFYDACRHLVEIQVFICINDYFEDVRKKKNKEQYKKVVRSLEELKSQPGLGNILQLRAAPVE